MFNSRGITFKAITLFLSIATVILATVHGYNYLFSRKIIITMAEENSRVSGSNVANAITTHIKPIEKVVENIALALENPGLTAEGITDLAKAIVKRNETIFGTAIAFEPYGLLNDQLFFSPYCYRENSEIKTKMLGSGEYRYFFHDWYQLPKELGRPVWTEPYYDTGGGDVLMTTYSVPFYRINGTKRVFAGVVTADISLQWIQELFAGITLYKTGYAILLSRNGAFIAHPSKELILNETIFSLAESRHDTELWRIGKALINGETGFVERKEYTTGKQVFLYYMPLGAGGWSLAFIFPKDEVLAAITNLSYRTLFIDLIGWLVLVLAITWLTRRFTTPLINLARSAKEISKGNLNAPIPTLSTGDELGQLTTSFQDMQQSLQQHIRQLTETTAQKERIESELRIARDIQMSILPKLFPPFPNKKEFDIFASIEPAREVGGDLYDFFFIDEHRFCFIIGDVSGKGVPAAFFMAVTKTLLKIIAEQNPDPGDILTRVNDDLALDNDSCMFVTLFIGILDIRSGVVHTGNAGHNPPVLLCGKDVTFLSSPHEPIAGAMDGLTYSTQKLNLNQGDVLFLYTDGVTEAMNRQDAFYTDEKLLQELKVKRSKDPDLHPEQIIKTIEKSIIDFAEGAEQSDDITMLSIRFNKKE